MTFKAPKFLIKEEVSIYQEKRKTILTASYLKEFDTSPALCHGTMTGKFKRKETEAFKVGTDFHSYFLERDKFDEDFIIEPDGENFPNAKGDVTSAFRNTKGYKEWKEGLGDQRLVSLDDIELLKMMSASIMSHPIAKKMFSAGVSEHVVRAELHGVKCQIRIDYYTPDRGIIDLKSCDNLDAFGYSIGKYGYPTSGAFYRKVFQEKSKEFFPPNYYLVAVEKKPPYRTGVWKISEDVMDMAEKMNAKNIKHFKECSESGVWPLGYEEMNIYEYI